jgi:type I restriction enzyme R subunit
MPVIPDTEADFERLIVSEMTADGDWLTGDPAGYDAELGLYSADLIAFVSATQAKKWQRLVGLSGGEAQARMRLLRRVAEKLKTHGATIEVLRKGVNENNIAFSLCQLRPAHSLDEATEIAYEANRLRVVRQVRFDPKSGDSVDLVLFVNGLPTATAELKNRQTGQNVEHAINQYRTDRSPENLLFGLRAFVHFAVDAELAYMTTRLAKKDTVFLPFNQGSAGAGRAGGKGNPGDPAGHPTSYVWREVWDRDRWLELIQKFVHVEPPRDLRDKRAKPTVVFPRFHQWHVVVECQAHAKVHGAGHNYLIQHSAGSGKTKEIAWLAHELSTLHADNSMVFNKVVVITDRRVLDAQLRRQIQQFEQVEGVVASIDKHSSQLREALVEGQAKVVVTTLQKFPFVLDAIRTADDGAAAGIKGRRYAVIVDEAHSSQSGESATDLKALLGSARVEDLDLDEDDGTPAVLLALLAARQRQPNLSFFAFTATPKGKTLELFGRRDHDGHVTAFHTYSMRQAIEEEFIVDVLRNYTTYEQLFRLEETDTGRKLQVQTGKASTRLAQFAQFHPYVKTQKAVVVVEHFARVVRPLLGHSAKAMVVCSSREEAVQWKLALDGEIARHDHLDMHTLVAFSGEVTVKHPEAANRGQAYTEPTTNTIGGRALPESKLPGEFDKDLYGVLVVAEKYQTGFDQPKLCGMYVDKKLGGVNAVQTLSRLNRAFPGKLDVYVLDFQNSAEEIRTAFEPYYGQTEATPTDPNVLGEAADAVRTFGVITDQSLAHFQDHWAQLEVIDEDRRHAVLSTATQPALDLALQLEDAGQRELRDAMNRFIRYYSFLAQALTWVPSAYEVLFQFSRVLLRRLQSGAPDGGVNLSGTVELTHFRLDEIGTEWIGLDEDDAMPLSAIGGDGTGRRTVVDIPLGPLGELVELFNSRYGRELGPTDALQVFSDVRDNVIGQQGEQLRSQALANDRDDFVRHRDDVLLDAALNVTDDRDRQVALLKALLDDQDFRARAGELIMGSVYDTLMQQQGV